MKINLLPKEPKRESIELLLIQVSANKKWINYHQNKMIQYQQEMISTLNKKIDFLKILLERHGIKTE